VVGSVELYEMSLSLYDKVIGFELVTSLVKVIFPKFTVPISIDFFAILPR
jgi:hypothetical protein